MCKNKSFTFQRDRIPFSDKDLYKVISNEIQPIQKMIEKKYGPIDKNYSLIINFNKENARCTETFEQDKTVRVNLPDFEMSPKDDHEQYLRKFDLSHECIHTITPTSGPIRVTYLEEGLAVCFSEKFTNVFGTPPGNYNEAKILFTELSKHDPNIIKKLRKKYSKLKISDYTPVMIKEFVPSLDDEFLTKITRLFTC